MHLGEPDDYFESSAAQEAHFGEVRVQLWVALLYQANRFSSTNRGVAIETREVTYPSNSRTADSFLASALCGGAIGKPNFGFPRARIRDIEPSV